METQAKTLREILSEFETRFSDLYQNLFPVRSRVRMTKASEGAWQLAEWVAGFKEGARQRDDEAAANMLLSTQCMASALASELDMWLAIRDDDPDRAWVRLIDMQEYLAIANRAHPTDTVSDFIARAGGHESTLFPPVLFTSPEFRYRPGRCSICSEQFDECSHEEDGIYMGRLCREVDRQKASAQHVALVKEPRDKRCRLASKEGDDGTTRHWFTGELVPDQNKTEGTGRTFGAIIYHFESLKNV